jgi:hypothetical protein
MNTTYKPYTATYEDVKSAVKYHPGFEAWISDYKGYTYYLKSALYQGRPSVACERIPNRKEGESVKDWQNRIDRYFPLDRIPASLKEGKIWRLEYLYAR